jgi:hypothetical protein
LEEVVTRARWAAVITRRPEPKLLRPELNPELVRRKQRAKETILEGPRPGYERGS